MMLSKPWAVDASVCSGAAAASSIGGNTSNIAYINIWTKGVAGARKTSGCGSISTGLPKERKVVAVELGNPRRDIAADAVTRFYETRDEPVGDRAARYSRRRAFHPDADHPDRQAPSRDR
jgi:hypothetical protein